MSLTNTLLGSGSLVCLCGCVRVYVCVGVPSWDVNVKWGVASIWAEGGLNWR